MRNTKRSDQSNRAAMRRRREASNEGIEEIHDESYSRMKLRRATTGKRPAGFRKPLNGSGIEKAEVLMMSGPDPL